MLGHNRQVWTCVFHKMQGVSALPVVLFAAQEGLISALPAVLFAAQEGLCYLQLVCCYFLLAVA